MFGEFKLIFLGLLLFNIICDIRYSISHASDKSYTRFETLVGGYADIVKIYVVVIVVLYILKINVNINLLNIISNILLLFVYSGFFKLLLQNIIRVKYSWVDTKKEEKVLRRAKRVRILLLFNYIVFMLAYRNLALTLYKGVPKNIIAISLTLIFGMKVSKHCAKVYNAIQNMN